MTSLDFPWPLLFSMTFQVWKMVFLNSMTFHDFPCPGASCLTKLNLIWSDPRMSYVPGWWLRNIHLQEDHFDLCNGTPSLWRVATFSYSTNTSHYLNACWASIPVPSALGSGLPPKLCNWLTLVLVGVDTGGSGIRGLMRGMAILPKVTRSH